MPRMNGVELIKAIEPLGLHAVLISVDFKEDEKSFKMVYPNLLAALDKNVFLSYFRKNKDKILKFFSPPGADEAMLVRTEEGIEGELGILFADKPGDTPEEIQQVLERAIELAAGLDARFDSVDVRIIEEYGMEENLYKLTEKIKDKKPTIVIVRTTTKLKNEEFFQ